MNRFGPRSLLVLVGVGQVVMAGRPWWYVVDTKNTVEVSGNLASAGLAQALAFAVLGGLLLTLTLGSVGRRVVGALVGIVQLGAIVLGVWHPQPSDAVLQTLKLANPLAETYTLQSAFGSWVFAALGVIGVLGSVWLMARPVTDSSRPDRVAVAGLAHSLDSWKAMDEGFDPTQDPQEERR